MIYKAYSIQHSYMVCEGDTRADLFDEITGSGIVDAVLTDWAYGDFAVYEIDDGLANEDLHHISNVRGTKLARLVGYYKRQEWEYDCAA